MPIPMERLVMINKIFWCIHPYCWSMYSDVPNGRDPELWNAILAWELRVHDLHLDFVSKMKPDEALIIYPIGASEPMCKLIEYSQQTLEERFILVDWQCASVEFLANVSDPIRRFLSDEKLPGKQEFIHNMLTDFGHRKLPVGLAEELETEIREACETIGYDWDYQALKVIYYNRVLALDIEEKFHQRGLVYNPQTVACLAFGEGLEQCAMTWKSMLPHYMGLANPIENDPKLSVSGAAYLINARFRERVAFDDDVRLLLWDGENEQTIALFYRTATRLKHPQLYAHIPLEGLNLEVWVMNEKFWAAEAHAVLPGGHLYVPVYTAIRTSEVNSYFYLIASGVSFEDFRYRLVNAEIRPVPGRL